MSLNVRPFKVLKETLMETTLTWIPELTDTELIRRATHIQPLVRMIKVKPGLLTDILPHLETQYIVRATQPGVWRAHPEGDLYYVTIDDWRSQSFLLRPRPSVVASNLSPLRNIRTYHHFTYPAHFTPTVAEVLAQIPAALVPRVVGFEVVSFPKTVDDLANNLEAFEAGYHVATTLLYTDY